MAEARCLQFVELSVVLGFLLIGFATSDISSDRAQCTDSLVGLATCLPYVGGNAKSPTPACCTGLKQVLDKSKKCLCILIKDRDDPQLGLKINASLAVSLPSVCSAPANITQCIDLLHLAPNSAEAKVFRQFGSESSTPTSGNSTTPSNSRTPSSSGASAEASGAGSNEGWAGKAMVFGAWIWGLVWLVNLGG